ncbi:uncharacterized protein BJ171DRAFT_62887 [Polychytrium aggregatum]|uniref:uncharacterized protein n=1 Tax=Polychytrium aggregatum TaxID=110093 RepID=UPI0022FF422E|nr:uncharacterized protein BJ171DRAFT_62887 [Polychytrium aggregatum]KAI9205565.1 hypothetical protein BJ171DRAFT_62887 [Polychytrium aggregatum]
MSSPPRLIGCHSGKEYTIGTFATFNLSRSRLSSGSSGLEFIYSRCQEAAPPSLGQSLAPMHMVFLGSFGDCQADPTIKVLCSSRKFANVNLGADPSCLGDRVSDFQVGRCLGNSEASNWTVYTNLADINVTDTTTLPDPSATSSILPSSSLDPSPPAAPTISPTDLASDTSINIPLIAGLSGGVVAIAALILLGTWCSFRRRKSRQQTAHSADIHAHEHSSLVSRPSSGSETQGTLVNTSQAGSVYINAASPSDPSRLSPSAPSSTVSRPGHGSAEYAGAYTTVPRISSPPIVSTTDRLSPESRRNNRISQSGPLYTMQMNYPSTSDGNPRAPFVPGLAGPSPSNLWSSSQSGSSNSPATPTGNPYSHGPNPHPPLSPTPSRLAQQRLEISPTSTYPPPPNSLALPSIAEIMSHYSDSGSGPIYPPNQVHYADGQAVVPTHASLRRLETATSSISQDGHSDLRRTSSLRKLDAEQKKAAELQQQQYHQYQQNPAAAAATARVAFKYYQPAEDDEISVHIGDNLAIIYRFDDGWAYGFNYSTSLR